MIFHRHKWVVTYWAAETASGSNGQYANYRATCRECYCGVYQYWYYSPIYLEHRWQTVASKEENQINE